MVAGTRRPILPYFSGAFNNTRGRSKVLITQQGSCLINTTQNVETHRALYDVRK